jgi:DNA-directed RNA polymerase subunit RPC12/RpoP
VPAGEGLAAAVSNEYVCEHCGGTFASDRTDEEAQAEALDLWGRRGDDFGMSIVCEDCFRKIMAWLLEKVTTPS